jgi:hypothetical protein
MRGQHIRCFKKKTRDSRMNPKFVQLSRKTRCISAAVSSLDARKAMVDAAKKHDKHVPMGAKIIGFWLWRSQV